MGFGWGRVSKEEVGGLVMRLSRENHVHSRLLGLIYEEQVGPDWLSPTGYCLCEFVRDLLCETIPLGKIYKSTQ